MRRAPSAPVSGEGHRIVSAITNAVPVITNGA
jgi:hypothetical protein